jgi:signal transduction histidine kinase
MEIWAAATSELASSESDSNCDLILTIIQSNTTIPVIVAENNEIIQYSNITINSTDTARYLANKLEEMQKKGSVIDIDLGNGEKQTLYYEDSVLLKQLSYYPYIQLLVVALFVLIAYVGLVSVKRAEQNKVWVGLSKETAHQLGTPISSLMAWVELLKINDNVDPTIVGDMDKDVKRLSTIAERFSKIGSIPDKELIYINELLDDTCNYMSTRISNRVNLNLHMPQDAEGTMACRSLIEWVIENLCKNAVDAMEGKGEINVTLTSDNKHIYIDVSDTGKGIARKEFDTIFKPGYTTKKRGWGLGLTLAKRIVEEYHNGRIYVKESEVGQGTTFRIELNKIA